VTVKSWSELQTMSRACRIVVDTLDVLEAAAVPGITTREMDRIAREQIEKAGARPAFLGYRGYPASLCISVNEEVVHGIPATSWASTWAAWSTASSATRHARLRSASRAPRRGG
jgi:methionyl aminopeptidase